MENSLNSTNAKSAFSRLRARLGNPLEWTYLERTLLLSCALLGFLVAYVIILFVIGSFVGLPAYVDPGEFHRLSYFLWVVMLLTAGVTAAGVAVRRSRERVKILEYAVGILAGATAGIVGYFIGPFSSPIWIAYLGSAVVAFMLLDGAVVLAGATVFLVIVEGSALGNTLGWFPHAPLWKYVPISDGRLALSWVMRLGIASFVFSQFTLALAFFIIERWRDHERRLAQAYWEQRWLVQAIENAGDTIEVADATGRLTYVNPAFQQLTGYTFEGVVGKLPHEIFGTEEFGEEFYASIWRDVKVQGQWTGRMRLRHKSGEEIDILLTASAVRDASGSIENYTLIKHDMTRQGVLEEQIRQAQKMEALGQLVGGIAHDFNNQLTVITTNAYQLMQSLSNGAGGGGAREWAREILESAQESAEMTRQLMAFKRQQTTAHKELLDFGGLVERVARVLKRTLGNGVEVTWDIGEERCLVRGDSTQLYQALMNIAVNARDAMPAGGKLNFSIARSLVKQPIESRSGIVPAGAYVALMIADTGAGMTEDVRTRIFEPFFTTKEPGRGTGLGLSVVYGIVGNHGGHIRCESTPGEGTTFEIYLPDAFSEKTEVVLSSDSAPTPSKIKASERTILLVEDQDRVRAVVRRVLEKKGYRVLSANGIDQALDLTSGGKEKIDLLFTDVVMPGGGGSVLAETISKMYPDCKIIYTSGGVDDVTAKSGSAGGMIEFLAKPYTEKDLLEKIEHLLSV